MNDLLFRHQDSQARLSASRGLSERRQLSCTWSMLVYIQMAFSDERPYALCSKIRGRLSLTAMAGVVTPENEVTLARMRADGDHSDLVVLLLDFRPLVVYLTSRHLPNVRAINTLPIFESNNNYFLCKSVEGQGQDSDEGANETEVSSEC